MLGNAVLAQKESIFVGAEAPSNNSITLLFGDVDSVIPLPAGLPLLLAGLGSLALMRRKRATNA